MKRQNSLIAYDNEKFYKNGFCDGIKIILESLKNEKQNFIKGYSFERVVIDNYSYLRYYNVNKNSN